MNANVLPIPADFPVRPLADGEPAKDRVTCGYCGLSWDDAIPTSWTPTPSAHCPFDPFHLYRDDNSRALTRALASSMRRERMRDIVSQWEDIRGMGDRGLIKAEGSTMVTMLDELRDLIRAEEDRETDA